MRRPDLATIFCHRPLAMMGRAIAAILLVTGVAACTSGRPAPPTPETPVSTAMASQSSSNCAIREPGQANRQNTVFVHPGLLLLNMDWDHSLAMEAGKFLQRQGLAAEPLEIRDREAKSMLPSLRSAPGTQFIGIHYSMGGKPEVLRHSYDVVRSAGQALRKPLRYHAIMIDPYGIASADELIDFNRPEVGYVFILVSSEYSFLRPSVAKFPAAALASGKIHFIFAEDLGETWGHFDMLTALRDSQFSEDQSSNKAGGSPGTSPGTSSSANPRAKSSGKKAERLFRCLASAALAADGEFPRQNPCLCQP